MPPPNRRVHQLHLSAPSQDLLWRGRHLLEDALHTVSLPVADTGQLVFIRHCNVGSITSAQSAMSLSLRLEKVLQPLLDHALPGNHPEAATALAVVFPDDLSAYANFAYRLATGQSLQAWFWPRLLPQWQPQQSVRETVLQLLAHLAAHSLAPLAMASVLQQLDEQGALTTLLEALDPADGRPLLAGCGLPTETVNDFQGGYSRTSFQGSNPLLKGQSPATGTQAYPALRLLRSRPRDWPRDDLRTLWLGVMGLVAGNPQRFNAYNLPEGLALVRQRLNSGLEYGGFDDGGFENAGFENAGLGHTNPEDFHTSADDDSSATEAAPPQSAFAPSLPDQRAEPGRPPLPATLSPPAEPARLSSKTTQHPTLNSTLRPLSAEFGLPGTASAFTDCAGLFFLLKALCYLRFERYWSVYQSAYTPDAWGHQLLHWVACRCGIPSQDAARLLVAGDRSGAQPIPKSLLMAWYGALRGWIRRYSGLTLQQLVHRPGYLAVTPTHLDIGLDLARVDIRIRRAGLDLNPGWLPWFGRVVQFHYYPLGDCDESCP